MWRLLRSLALGALALCAVTAPALAQRTAAPRFFTDQQTTYLRFSVNFNSCVAVANTCSFKVGAVPYNAFMVRAYAQTLTGWTATTTVALGTTSGGAQLVAAAAPAAVGGAAVLTIVAANLGIAATGNGIAQTGALGGFDIYATIGVLAPTVGASVYVLEFILPNDGACTAVPTGATAPGC
jgi:hypothetical protein